ncbi:sirohydrochlorin chelatase [Sporosarcina sp. YIM B06819]|uniref:sirohydrochlorin chelatase n=1 Tax=Sporosarcina sp. YIM B06819 TaxID=3081769 RepID=UPI00298C8346|nr:sirohydrochlorin chelatase [Sporosarcina sp. YIM B06819]
MQAVLYVGHGSRIQAGVEEAIQFIENCKVMIDVAIQEICFLELASPSVDEGITKCVERGATKIAVVPILLLTANHANEDIPFEIEVGKIMYPDVEFTYGKAFGIHPKIVDSLYDRVIQKQVPIDVEAQVLLVGRGSSDVAVKRDLTEIAQLLANKYPFQQVDVCFLYGTSPSFDEALAQIRQTTPRQIFIIPYLLFSGILMNGIERKIAKHSSNDHQIILCENLGYHKYVQDVLVERVNDLLAAPAIM